MFGRLISIIVKTVLLMIINELVMIVLAKFSKAFEHNKLLHQ